MRRRIAQSLAIAFIVSLGATQGPNNSEAKAASLNTAQTQSEFLKAQKPGKPKPYQVGTASWYGEDFEGKPTASGEPYEMYDMTAASLTIPLGTYVKVTNLHNGKAVVVRINDRGPVVPGRIIDVSYGTAKALQFTSRGLQRVRLDLVTPNRTNGSNVKLAQAQPKATKSVYQTVADNHPPVAKLP
jgi:rare lipoprotein A (peptidoglycan hydrolase)